AIWLAAEQPCGKRLKAALKVWLPHSEKRRGRLPADLRQRVLAISSSSIDRLLAPCRASQGGRARCGTRPGTLLRKQIPVRTEHWDVSGPGFIEADTVAHCGESMAGEVCWSLTATDGHTQWTGTRAVFNGGQYEVAKRIAEIEAALPFAILGLEVSEVLCLGPVYYSSFSSDLPRRGGAPHSPPSRGVMGARSPHSEGISLIC